MERIEEADGDGKHIREGRSSKLIVVGSRARA